MEASSLHQDSKPLPNLPQEIIIEILSRLPVKSLLKFRCVCKSWLSLISTSQFIKTHLKKSTNSTNYADHTLILGSHTVPITYYTCSLYSLLYDTSSINTIDLDIPMRDPIYLLWVVGTCNGLLCVSVDPDTLILYNPSMKKFKKLPFSGTDVQSSSYITYGFGYDELNDDYKVVELSGFTNDGVAYDTEVKVYSLRNNSWRKIKNYPDGPVSSGSGTFVSGKLHWSAASSNGSWIILALDLVTEEYAMMAEPKFEDGGVNWTLVEFGGCLCVCCEYDKIRVDVWVMKEYGVRGSWTKLVSIPYPVDLRGHLWPVFVAENGEKILLNYEPCVMMYNSRDKAFETREIHGRGGGDPLLVASQTYVESLVPPCFDGNDVNGSWIILSLDLVTEEYPMMAEPKFEDGGVNWTLVEFGGCLCVCCEYDKIRVDVWVMKEYGVRGSWTKLVSIPYPVDLRGHLWPVFVAENGEKILLNCEPCVMMYNSRDEAFETREIHGLGGGDPLLVASQTYIESLVPP